MAEFASPLPPVPCRRPPSELENSGLPRYPLAMIVQEIPIESVDFDDESFRISEDLHSPSMQASLMEIGQLTPVLLLEDAARRVAVCGFRRLRALRRMGRSTVLAHCRAREDCDTLDAFRHAIFDNLPHREFSALEKARILSTLKGACGVPRDVLVARYLPLLRLPAHENVLKTYLALHALDPGLRECLNDGRLSPASAERLSGVAPEARRRFACLLAEVRLSASRQRELLDLAEDLAAMTESGLGEVFESPAIQTVLRDVRLSPFQRGERIHEHLYRLRNPRLSKAHEKFHAGREQLGLPGIVRISPDPYFETPRLRVEFDVVSPEGFREIAAALRDAAERPALDDLFRVS